MINHDVEELSILVWRAAHALNTHVDVCPTEFVSMVLLNFALSEQSPYSAKVREESIKVFQSNAEHNRYAWLKHSKGALVDMEKSITEVLNGIAIQATSELAAIENLLNNANQLPTRIKNFQRNAAVKSMVIDCFNAHRFSILNLLGPKYFNVPGTYIRAFEQEIETQMQEKNAMNVQWTDHELNQRALENNNMFIQSVTEAFTVALCSAKTISKQEMATVQDKVKNILDDYRRDVTQRLEKGVIEKVELTPSQYVQRLKLQAAETTIKRHKRTL